jgi:prevent-host-death family protein
MTWQLQTAKQKFSELVSRAIEEGPQVVTRRGEEVVVVVSIDEYRRLRKRKPEPDFWDLLTSGPSFDDLDLERSKDLPREVEL